MNKTNDYFRRRLCGLFLITDYRREDLARHLRVPVKTVREWESGEKIPDVYQFREIANFFELPYEWFLDGTDGMPDTSELAELLGLSESTVEMLMKLSENAPPDVLDVVDDTIFTLAAAVRNVFGGVK
ncbi:MAG: helix-turn-helix transcriptional regulator [Oscillospiraceae bacterium]|nr:helix-turn-helix transcriptional regulator [Oscillospiraceae bacterium]